MKKLYILILLFGVICPIYAQKIDLTKLSKSEREECLFEIATEAMKKYAPTYYKSDLKPVLVYEGLVTDKSSQYYGLTGYRVEFPFDISKAIDEGIDNNMYGGDVGIMSDGRIDSILPYGWMVPIYVGDAKTRNGQPQIAQPTKLPRRLLE